AREAEPGSPAVPLGPDRRRHHSLPRAGRARLHTAHGRGRAAPRSGVRVRRTPAVLGSLRTAAVDLALRRQDEDFALEAREWLREHGEAPPRFASIDEEGVWGRHWQAKLATDRRVGLDR